MRAYWIVLIAVLCGVFWLNSTADVSGMSTFDVVYDLARRQGSGELMVWERLFDQRAWVKAKILTQRGCPRRLFLGTSTIGSVAQVLMPGEPMLNGWMTDTGIEDYEAVTAILQRSGCRPKDIVLSIDPWFFVPEMVQVRWLSLRYDYAAYQRQVHFLDGVRFAATQAFAHLKERLNFGSTRASVEFMLRRGEGAQSGRPLPVLIAATAEDYCKTARQLEYIRSNDGHFTTCPQFIADEEHVRQKALDYLPRAAPLLHWQRVDQERFDRLARVLLIWRGLGAQVHIVSPPLHPLTYRQMMDRPNIAANLATVDRLLSSLGTATGAGPALSYADLGDAESLGCRPSDFNDSHHYKQTCAKKVVARLFPADQAGPAPGGAR